MQRATVRSRLSQRLAGRPTELFAAVAAADIALAGARKDRARWLTKPLLMPTLMLGRSRPTQRALAFGAAGDIALLGEGPKAFTAGLSAFLAGHLAWIAALRSRPGGGRVKRQPVLAVPYALAWVALNAYLWPRTGRDRYPVLAYSAVLTAMALVALDTGRTETAAGAALFMASDSLLALQRFGDVEFPGSEAVVMATYAAGQALLAGVAEQPEAH